MPVEPIMDEVGPDEPGAADHQQLTWHRRAGVGNIDR
jgi:hypothetical protein